MVLRGYFCSFACGLAYCLFDNNSPGGHGEQWLRLFAKRAFGLSNIGHAPPREWLSKVTIDIFRQSSISSQIRILHDLPRRFLQREIEAVASERRQAVLAERESLRRSFTCPSRSENQATHQQNRRRKRTAKSEPEPTPLQPLPPAAAATTTTTTRPSVLNILGATKRKRPSSQAAVSSGGAAS